MLNAEQQTTGGAVLRLLDSEVNAPNEFTVYITSTNRLRVSRTGDEPTRFDLETINAMPTLRETHVVVQQTGFGIAIYFDGVLQATNVGSTSDHWMHGLTPTRLELGDDLDGQFSGRLGSILVDATPISNSHRSAGVCWTAPHPIRV